MKTESGLDEFVVGMGTLLIILVSIAIGVGFYHYGFYEGKAEVLEQNVCQPREKSK